MLTHTFHQNSVTHGAATAPQPRGIYDSYKGSYAFLIALTTLYYVDHVGSPAGFSSGPNQEHCWQSTTNHSMLRRTSHLSTLSSCYGLAIDCPKSIDMGAVY